MVTRIVALAHDIRPPSDGSTTVYKRLRALTTHTFEEGVRLAVNHSGDSDATGAMTGALLGALYGADTFPARWLENLELREEIDALATDLFLEFGHCPHADLLEGSDWDRYPGW